MKKFFSYIALLLIVLPFMSCQEKMAEANVPKWILSMVSESKNTSVETDFTNILSDKRVPYIGYIGTDYHDSQTGSGVFTGYLLFYWYETNDGKFVYDDIDSHSDSYCNNQYAGTWKSNKTKKSKPCAWGQYRVPNSGDLDIGAGDFSVNPKYAKNGWEKK